MSTTVEAPEMELVDVGGVEMEVHDSGSDDPIVFIHSPTREEWTTVLADPALEDYRQILYHRRGFGGSDDIGLPLEYPEQSVDCHAVMDHLGLDRAHIVGLSGGGAIALQFAVDYPEAVHTLTLLEPAIPQAWEDEEEFHETVSAATPLFEAGEIAEGIDMMYQYLLGEDYADAYDRTLPEGWLDRLIADWPAASMDFEATNVWEISGDNVADFDAPVLNVRGEHTTPGHQECHRLVQSWFPQAESVVVPEATHAIPMTNPTYTAEALAEFFIQHPIE
jgi:pimeloyl-ACP methyl ester carboxylesterase